MKEQRTFKNVRIDTDTAEDFLVDGSSDFYFCCEEYGNKGAVTNTQGNVLITYPLTLGFNKVIGQTPNFADGYIYFFLYCDPAPRMDASLFTTNKILRFNTVTNVIELVAAEYYISILVGGKFTPRQINDIGFGWTQNTLIINPGVVDNKLYWTDNKSPRKINITSEMNWINSFLSTSPGYDNIYIDNSGGMTSPPKVVGHINSNIETTYEIEIIPNPSNTSYNLWYRTATTLVPGTPADTSNADWFTVPLVQHGANYYSYNFGNGIVLYCDKISIQTHISWKFTDKAQPVYNNPDEITINLAKQPPSGAPRTAFISNPEITLNIIQQIPFQFCYRHIYNDWENSVYSNPSLVLIPEAEENGYCMLHHDTYARNSIVVSLNSGHNTVNQIELAVKIGNIWYTYDTIDRPFLPDYTEFDYIFDNTKARTAAILTEIINPEFNVPLQAGQQTITSQGSQQVGNLVLADLTYGFDQEDLDIELNTTPLIVGSNQGTSLGSLQKYHSNNLSYYPEINYEGCSVLPTNVPPASNYALEYQDYLVIQFPTPDVIEQLWSKEVYSFIYPGFLPYYAINNIYLDLYNVVTGLWERFTWNNPQHDLTSPVAVHYFQFSVAAFLASYPDNIISSFITYFPTGIAIKKTFTNESVNGITLNGDYLLIKRSHFYKYATGSDYLASYTPPEYKYKYAKLYYDCLQINVTSGDNPVITYPVNYNQTANVKYKTWLPGKYPVGIVYEDVFGRSPATWTNPKCFVNIPDFVAGERPIQSNFPILNFIDVILWKIYHQPPEWAHTFKLVLLNNIYADYQMLTLSNIFIDPNAPQPQYPTRLLPVGGTEGTMNTVYQLGYNTNVIENKDVTLGNVPLPTVATWQYQAGDRVRFVAYNTIGHPAYLYPELIDVPLIENTFPITGFDGQLIADQFEIFIDGSTIYNILAKYCAYSLLLTAHEMPFPWTSYPHPTPLEYIQNSIVLVYRPSDNSQVAYSDISAKYPILDPGLPTRRHSAGDNMAMGRNIEYDFVGEGLPANTYPVQDQVLASKSTPVGNPLPATGQLNTGNSYLYLRLIDYTVVVSKNLSDWYSSTVYDFGKQYPVNPTMKRQRVKGEYRYSQGLIPRTEINGFSDFEANAYDILSDNYGTITGVRQVGDVLKFVMEKKVPRRYLSKATFYSAQANGTNVLASVDTVLGTLEIPIEPYGCQNPESIIVYGSHLAYWDGLSGKMVRESENGAYVISSYGNNSFFNNLRNMKYNLLRVYGCWDEVKNEAYWTFVDEGATVTSVTNNLVNGFGITPPTDLTLSQLYDWIDGLSQLILSAPDKQMLKPFTIAFEDDLISSLNSWKTFYPFIPEMYGVFGNTIVSFKNGQLYLHNTDAFDAPGKINNRNTFYDIPYPMMLNVYFNKYPDTNKVYLALEMNTNSNKDEWQVIEATIAVSENNPLGQRTKVKDFTNVENLIYASLGKDINTSYPENWALLNGKDMRGTWIRVTLINKSVDEVILRNISVRNSLSEYQELK